MNRKYLAAVFAAFAIAVTASGCATLPPQAESGGGGNDDYITETVPPVSPPAVPPAEDKPSVPVDGVKPEKNTVSYISVKTNGVNIRTGAGTSYSVLGVAEQSTLYAFLGEENGWYKTQYKNRVAYISSKYCILTDMDSSGDERIEAVIAEGTKLLGTPYVYGAVRYHDGNGNKLKNFKISEFDCSSLMQYMFYHGADKLLTLTTRTQVKQGVTVSKSQLKRGDLMFFTNSTRKDYVGIERIGHVALYLGDNKILHTASDYAKIEEISSVRWGYYIQSQRII